MTLLVLEDNCFWWHWYMHNSKKYCDQQPIWNFIHLEDGFWVIVESTVCVFALQAPNPVDNIQLSD